MANFSVGIISAITSFTVHNTRVDHGMQPVDEDSEHEKTCTFPRLRVCRLTLLIASLLIIKLLLDIVFECTVLARYIRPRDTY